MHRRHALAVLAFSAAWGIPRKGHVTILAQESKLFPGFHLLMNEQIGCETTGDEPSEETWKAANTHLKDRLAAATAVAERAYAHFTTGAHPFRRHLSWLSTAEEHLAGKQMPFGDMFVFLHLKTDTPPAIAEKLSFEFLLAQAFEGGFLRSKEELAAVGQRATADHAIRTALETFHPMFPWKLAELLAALDPPKLDALAAGEHKRLAAHAAILATVLRDERIGEPLLAKLRELDAHTRSLATYVLLTLSPLGDADRATLRRFITELEKDGVPWMQEPYSRLLEP